MDDRELRAGGGLDHLPDAHELPTLLGREPEPELLDVGDDVEHPAVGDVDGHGAGRRDGDRRVQVDGERRDVAERHARHLAVAHLGRHADEARRRLEDELRHRLLDREHPGLEQRRDDADGVRPRHRRILDLLHDHEAGVRRRIGRRQDEVAVRGGVPARLAQHPPSHAVGVVAEVRHLLEHRPAGNVEDAADDHPSGLAAGVQVDRVDELRDPHASVSPTGRAPSPPRRR